MQPAYWGSLLTPVTNAGTIVTLCLSYCTVAGRSIMTKALIIKKHLIRDLLTVSGGESFSIMEGSVAAGMQAGTRVAHILILKQEAESETGPSVD